MVLSDMYNIAFINSMRVVGGRGGKYGTKYAANAFKISLASNKVDY